MFIKRRKDGIASQRRHTGGSPYPGLRDQPTDCNNCPPTRGLSNPAFLKNQRGISFVELIMFIIIVSVAVAGVLLTLNTTVKASADPMLQKQALSVAESVLDEIALRPVTRCDPDGPDPDGPTGPAPCAIAEAIGPEGGETRYSATAPFDNVNDYSGFTMSPIRDAENNAIPGLATYTATVNVANTAVAGVAAGDALLVTVRVTGPANIPDISVSSVRIRYAADAN